MLAHVNADVFNKSKCGESLGITHPTGTYYLDILVDTFMIRILQPFENNLKKRMVKSPKVLFRDVGLLHALLGILRNRADTFGPGHSFEVEAIFLSFTSGRRNRSDS